MSLGEAEIARQRPPGVWNGRARRNYRTGKCWRKLQRGWKKRLGCNYVGSLVSCKEFRQRPRGVSEDSLSIQQGVWARRLGPALWTRVQGRVVGLLKIPFTQVQWITEERWDKVLTVRGRHWEEQQECGGPCSRARSLGLGHALEEGRIKMSETISRFQASGGGAGGCFYRQGRLEKE